MLLGMPLPVQYLISKTQDPRTAVGGNMLRQFVARGAGFLPLRLQRFHHVPIECLAEFLHQPGQRLNLDRRDLDQREQQHRATGPAETEDRQDFSERHYVSPPFNASICACRPAIKPSTYAFVVACASAVGVPTKITPPAVRSTKV